RERQCDEPFFFAYIQRRLFCRLLFLQMGRSFRCRCVCFFQREWYFRPPNRTAIPRPHFIQRRNRKSDGIIQTIQRTRTQSGSFAKKSRIDIKARDIEYKTTEARRSQRKTLYSLCLCGLFDSEDKNPIRKLC